MRFEGSVVEECLFARDGMTVGVPFTYDKETGTPALGRLQGQTSPYHEACIDTVAIATWQECPTGRLDKLPAYLSPTGGLVASG